MSNVFQHDILATAADLESATRRVRAFLEATPLVEYDRVGTDQPLCMNGGDVRFMNRIESAVAENRRLLTALLAELQHDGAIRLDDLAHLPQGYQSKLFHVIAHILDGFFGIDSRFYDLDENSHWLTDGRRRMLARNPEQCWLVRVRAALNGGTDFAGRSERFRI